jgi:hypothetical protein
VTIQDQDIKQDTGLAGSGNMKIKDLLTEESYLDTIKRAFDFSGDEFEKYYVPYARKWLQVYDEDKVLKMMRKKFPSAMAMDLSRAIKFAQRGNY